MSRFLENSDKYLNIVQIVAIICAAGWVIYEWDRSIFPKEQVFFNKTDAEARLNLQIEAIDTKWSIINIDSLANLFRCNLTGSIGLRNDTPYPVYVDFKNIELTHLSFDFTKGEDLVFNHIKPDTIFNHRFNSNEIFLSDSKYSLETKGNSQSSFFTIFEYAPKEFKENDFFILSINYSLRRLGEDSDSKEEENFTKDKSIRSMRRIVYQDNKFIVGEDELFGFESFVILPTDIIGFNSPALLEMKGIETVNNE